MTLLRPRARLVAPAFAALLLTVPLVAQRPAATPAAPAPTTVAVADVPLPADTAVRTGTLPNGLRYYVRRNTTPERRAELRLAVDVGSLLEEERERGLAHFVEHMAFNGTRGYEKQEIVSFLERVGMRFGADLNAYTGFDETVYQLTLPTDSAGVLAKGIDILGEWAGAVTFDSLEVERERPVVIEEWRLGQGAGSRLRDQQLPVIFHGSRYALRLPIGDTAVLRTAPPATLRAFYDRWYRPDRMAVVAVGDFDVAQVEGEIRRRFGALAARTTAGAPPAAEMPPHRETLVSVATDPEATGTTVSVLFKHPPSALRTEGDFRRSLVESLHDQMLNARFHEMTQRPEAPFLGAGASNGQFVRALDAYSLGAAVADSGVLRGLEALLVEAARVDRHGFAATELERAKRDLLRGMERAYAERGKTTSASFADEYVSAALQGEPHVSAADAWALSQRLVPAITLDEVNAVGRRLIRDTDRVLLVSAPAKADVRLPAAAELLAVFGRVEGQQVAAYTDQVADAPLVASTPTAGRVTFSATHPGVGITEWRLSNGVRVLVKPTTFKDDQVLMQARSPGGHSLASDADYLSASLSASVVGLGGFGAFDQVQLEKQLAGKAVGLSPFVGDLEEGVTGTSSVRDVETMLQLTYLAFTAPREDSAAFAAFQARARSALENRGRSPESAFADTLQVTLTQHHPRARPATPALLGEIDLGRAVRFYRDRFADASDFTFVFVGTVDTTALRPLVERWLGALPALRRSERGRDVGIRPPAGIVRRDVFRGVEPKGSTRLVLHGPAEYGMPQRFELAALAQLLDMRLRDVLREELGGTYGASVGSSLAREPRPEYSLSVDFGAAPERVAELTGVVLREMDSLKVRGPSAADLAKVQEMMRRSIETGLEQNATWLGQIVSYDRMGLPLTEIPNERQYVDALTPERLRAAAQRYLDTSRYVQVSLYPETMKGKVTP